MKKETILSVAVILLLISAARSQETAQIFNELTNMPAVTSESTAESVAPVVVEPVPVGEEATGTVVVESSFEEKVPEAVRDDSVETVAVSTDHPGGSSMKNGLISLNLRDVELSNVIRLFATLSDANIIVPDLGAEAGIAKVDVNLKDVEWKPALQAILDSHDLELYEKIPSSQVYSVRKKLPPEEAVKNTQTFIFENADIAQATEMIKGIVGERGEVFAYPQGNAIVVKTTQEIMDDVAQVAGRIDTSRQQALIEARIMELSDGGSNERGVDFAWDDIITGDGKLNFGSIGVPTSLYNALLLGTPTGTGGLTLNSGDVALFIAALETKSNARTVSNPKVIVANGETAKIDILTKIPKLQRSVNSKAGADGNTIERTIEVKQDEDGQDPDTGRKRYVEYEFGIRLDVTPTIYAADNIAVQIVPIISRVNTDRTTEMFVGVDGDGNPIVDTYYAIDEKRVNTTFMMANKQTAVIGGLTETENIDRERKVPLLGEIPLLRHLFTHKYSEQVQKENIIFVTVSLEDGQNYDVGKAVKQSPLTRKQLVRDESNQIIDDQSVEVFRASEEARVKEANRINERKEQAQSHDHNLRSPLWKVLRP